MDQAAFSFSDSFSGQNFAGNICHVETFAKLLHSSFRRRPESLKSTVGELPLA
jgi:hypothetical protein